MIQNLTLSAGKNCIRIVSPSGVVDPVWINGAVRLFERRGYRVVVGEYAKTVSGRFAGSAEQRLKDLQIALDDPDCAAILCSRGGYGLVQIIDKIDFTAFSKNPKWLIGFSDITVLHNAIGRLGIPSLHAVMAKQLTLLPQDEISVSGLMNILAGELPEYNISPHSNNRIGCAVGKLTGGNLSVIYGLRSTPFDIQTGNTILFIEDIAEKPYHIDRMMQNLRLSGILAQLSGMIVGQFTDCTDDPLMLKTVSQIIADAVSGYDYPVCFGFPAGHDEVNYPLILGAEVRLEVSQDNVLVSFR